ncbi:putative ubiquitin-conjugating enzyme E2 38 [Impatiens glandulifera]|uniref:putative ubiquitin-conjugating enzyme E2 38 n=1 Tax=Impatiens glandulifera TaxID=253017 RepID=UPI001FB07AEF|nr:putative ubiquitin-conjugating enzyme E2 38 [Impatiens glandulifera]
METNSFDVQDYEDPISNKEDQNQMILGATLIDGHGSTSGSTYDCIIDTSYHENNNEDVDDNDDASGDASDYDDNDEYIYDEDDDDGDEEEDDDYLLLQAQLDNDRLPSGVETPIACLNIDLPGRKLMVQPFGGFTTVDHFPDHHFMDVKVHQPTTKWIKRIQEEWKILNDLPEAIYVKASEIRMELMQAVIVGPAGTPYHDGLFIFDIVFPSSYPDKPPMVHYHSGGLRLNPNLYNCGKVCLSLLNTWTGDKDEKWKPKDSTMLQVLVSIQGLILNSEPFFNEPGHSSRHAGLEGKTRSKHYNEKVFILSLKTMGYTLANPPKHFEELIKWHFRVYAHDILSACKSYLDDGTKIGWVRLKCW